MKELNKFIKNPFFIIFLFGSLLNIPFFIQSIFAEVLAFILIAPIFIALRKIPTKHKYFAGLLFFGTWLIPTSLWYFNFMKPYLAILSLTFFSFMANIFLIPSFLKKKSIILEFSLITILWISITAVRVNLPVLENWWIPHLAYTQGQNLLVLQIANFTSIFGIMFLILFSNAFIAYFWLKNKKNIIAIFIISLFLIFSLGNYFIYKKSDSNSIPFTLIAVQSTSKDFKTNNKDILRLENLTKKALLEVTNKEKNIFVLWPENKINEKNNKQLQDFSKSNNINLIFNRLEKNQGNPFNTVVMFDKKGKEILKNYKVHSAPGEKIQVKKDNHQSIKIENIKITTAICYDLHYPDISKRIKDSELLFAPVNDRRFGNFMTTLHAKDMIFRAIENRVNILAASNNAPTIFIDKYGVIKKGPLKVESEDYIIK